MTQTQHAQLTSPTHATPVDATRAKVAVVLNGNARSVDERLVSDLRGLLQDETLYVSHSLDQSRFIARHVINQGFDVVLCGGGDGTFTQVLSDIAALRPAHLPAFGLLRLGTGNALANALGARGGLKGLAADLRAIRDPRRRATLDLISSEGRLSPFAGVGLDAMILEDYNATRNGALRQVLGGRLDGPLGYGLAIASRSTWRLARNERPVVTIRNEGAPVYQLDHAGRRVGRPLQRGELIYRGPVTIAATSTIPFYGFRCRLFPQADTLEGRFQLRVSNCGPLEIIPQLHKLFSGELRSDNIKDYACRAISIHHESGTPFQIGGDLVGTRRSVTLKLRQIEAALGSDADLPSEQPAPALRSIG